MLSDIVTDNALRYPDVPAYRLGQRSVTHGALRERAVRLVSAMAKAGVRRQDRIAVLSRNSVEFGELMASTQLSGIIMATVNFRLSPPEVLDVLRRVSPSVVFCADEFALMIAELVQCLPSPPLLVSIGEVGRPDMVDYEGFVAGGDAGEPAFVADTLAYLAQLRGEEPDALAAATSENFYRLFNKAAP